MDTSKRRFFIALLPPEEIQDYAKEIQQYFEQKYDSRRALRSPPHITLQPPFEWQLDSLSVLEESLSRFVCDRSSIPITLSGFSTFAPRVIYINVLKTPELLTLQADLMAYLEASLEIVDATSKHRPFAPHMTVASGDLKRQNFNFAWREFQHRPLQFEFTAVNLTLLIYNGQCWNVHSEFPLGEFSEQ
ncbi:MAG TPA: 2'-5' RNA ligase [Cyanobacteria bacterium UBA8553]|nr:2'-5' RNA ligase [Cyanobacteria bacterium UBA8553]HAJ61172.1 2'-5' RNA ligase [Cyanobacteria bacterium UBA8543]